MDGWMEKKTDLWKGGRMDGWIDGRIKTQIDFKELACAIVWADKSKICGAVQQTGNAGAS